MANDSGPKRRRFAIGAGYSFSDTRLIFFDGSRYRIRQSAYSLSFVVVLKKGLVLGAAIGPNMGGQIDGLRKTVDDWTIQPGVIGSLTVARRYFGKKPEIPFLLVVGSLSGSSTSTRRESDGARAGLHALDVKADVSFGWTIGEAFSPYVAVRAFGGPIFWKPDDRYITGGDLYHVSLATGFNLSIVDRASVYFDGAFVGMRGLSGGVAVRF